MQRNGATLVEVLVAIFVMGLGMIALLTLFPLGALRMAQAIQDDLCATSVKCADAIATLKNVRNDPFVRTPPWLAAAGGGDIFQVRPGLAPAPPLAPADPDGPSYPVYVDPFGYRSLLQDSLPQKWLAVGTGSNYRGGAVDGLLARTAPTWTMSVGAQVDPTKVFKWFALLDGYQFETNELAGGQVQNFNPTGGAKVIRRDIRYSWAYLLQRPRSGDPSVATCAVVVYNKRPLGLSMAPNATSGNSQLILGEVAYNAIFDLATNSITIDWGAGGKASIPPSVRPGDWLLDTTLVKSNVFDPGAGPPRLVGSFGSAHGYFYRVVSVTPQTATSASYEVQQPIRGFTSPPLTAPATRFAVDSYFGVNFVPPDRKIFIPPGGVTTSFAGGVIVLDGVADVYERGLDRKFD